jgi:hypothetical protein
MIGLTLWSCAGNATEPTVPERQRAGDDPSSSRKETRKHLEAAAGAQDRELWSYLHSIPHRDSRKTQRHVRSRSLCDRWGPQEAI